MTNNAVRCGYVAIVGRPNVGKSTLLNHLLGQKISITSPKPQTTRHRLLGIKTTDDYQIIYVDTPGLHQDRHNAMNRYLNRAATSSLTGVEVIVWLVEALRWTEADEYVLKALIRSTAPVILGVNKVDKVKEKRALLPYLEELSAKRQFAEVFPLSALTGQNLSELELYLSQQLPLGVPFFPMDQVTDRSERFLVAELIREQLVCRLGAELPYRLTVETELFETSTDITHLSAIIWVERPGQKAIVIGKHGRMLKMVGQEARKGIETLLEQHVFLQLWVKVREGWSDDERALRHLGYSDQ